MSTPKFSLYVRRIHMYLALFLTPWLLVYALSSLVFNHFGIVRAWYGGAPNQFVQVEDRDYSPAFPENVTTATAAEHILTDLDLKGAHFVRGSLEQGRLTINRQGGFVAHRIVYFPKENRLTVEKQKPNTANFLTRLHIRAGYGQGDSAVFGWGFAVDLTVIAMGFWILSGLWMWWEIKPARIAGSVFALVGIGLFGLLLFTI